MRENLTSGSRWQGMKTRMIISQASFPDPTSGRVGVCRPFKHFSGFKFFLLPSIVHAHPTHKPLTLTVGSLRYELQAEDNKMRRVIYAHMVLLDGLIETEESYQDPNWAVSDEELSRHFCDFEAEVDAHLYGRRIYEALAAWWPDVDKDPSNPEYLVKYARIWKNKPKIVFSRTLDRAEWNSKLVKENAVEEIGRLKTQPGKDLSLYGSIPCFYSHSARTDRRVQILCQSISLGTRQTHVPIIEQHSSPSAR